MSGKGYQQAITGEPGTLGELYKSQLNAGLSEGAWELAGQSAFGFIGRAIKGGIIRRKQISGSEEMSNMLTEAGKRLSDNVAEKMELTEPTVKFIRQGGAGLLEGQKSKSFFSKFEAFLGETWIGGGRLRTITKEANPAALEQLNEELIQQAWREAVSYTHLRAHET